RICTSCKGAAMGKRFVFAAVVVAISFGLACAEEFTAIVTKAGDGKVTFTRFKKGEKGEATTLPVDAKCKYTKGKFDFEAKKSVADGEYPGGKEGFEKAVKEAAEKAKDEKKGKFGGGVFATLTTEGEGDKAKVVEIRVTQFDFKKKKKDDK